MALAQIGGSDPLSCCRCSAMAWGAWRVWGGWEVWEALTAASWIRPPSADNAVLQPQLNNSSRLPTSRLEQICRIGRANGCSSLDMINSVWEQRNRAGTGAVADDYIMGPKEIEVVVSLRGQENSRLSHNGRSQWPGILPRLPPIPATGP